MRALRVLPLLAVPFVLGACQSNAQTGTLIGAGAGALGGYIVGNEMDKDDDDDDHDDHRHYDRRRGRHVHR